MKKIENRKQTIQKAIQCKKNEIQKKSKSTQQYSSFKYTSKPCYYTLEDELTYVSPIEQEIYVAPMEDSTQRSLLFQQRQKFIQEQLNSPSSSPLSMKEVTDISKEVLRVLHLIQKKKDTDEICISIKKMQEQIAAFNVYDELPSTDVKKDEVTKPPPPRFGSVKKEEAPQPPAPTFDSGSLFGNVKKEEAPQPPVPTFGSKPTGGLFGSFKK